MSPLERPDPGVVAAAIGAGAVGALDLGRDPDRARAALAALGHQVERFAVRFPDGCPLGVADLPAAVDTVIVTSAAAVAGLAPRRVLVQATSLAEAQAAVAAGADGIIAKGSEAGGRVGETTTFVLVQELVGALAVPVWAQGGLGVHTAAACRAGGAAGVVLDSQLALCREATLPADVRAAIAAMDGSETTVVAGHRVFTRPDLPVAALPDDVTADDVRARLGADSLTEQLVPVGQDGASAASFARQFGGVAAAVRGVRAAMTTHVQLAAELAPLAPGAPLAAGHGLRYPIAQGPMSRVSDRAAFAEAVAAAGGLPFLALSLMPGAEVRALVAETAARLGDRPWGVGILGFVPAELREEQLAVLREIKPPVALIAGGRPSQAAPLEADGIATYLHVPSPGLLDLFLKDGARRFVFEGRECGGHVGPRSSFALWEIQLERLLAHPAVADVSVLFAGGIHDARSCAMVAAMAAPLAARGAKVGVLMGTAYLFTHEAVASGAIQPGFQAAAVACDRTSLLETAPGHATRCADTAFTAAFAAEKARLAATGATPQERWAALEQLNLGRLRIAAKGLRREGDAIVAVDAASQAADGMYMIGQVAALRSSTCSIAELHDEVSAGGQALVAAHAAALDDARPRPVRPRGHATPVDVAIVGVAAIFPGAGDTDAFWANIVGGKDAVREVPPERWSVEQYFDPSATGTGAGKKTPCKWGGFLDPVPFDPLAYGIPPRSLEAIEPVQLLSLEVARRALDDAGYASAVSTTGRALDRERTAVIFGAEAGTDLSSAYGFRAMFPHYVGELPAALDRALPTLTEDSFPGVLANVIAGRIANRLDLGGANYTVDAACASSLAAVDLAVKELVTGGSDVVVCGGADLHNSINDYLLFASVHALSTSGRCHTFDADADGIVLGEGVAAIVLKRLADAERDGDRIYAVVKGVAGASDGKSLGLTAPRKEGQIRAVERAYRQAGVSPAEVGLVEAHGTGTVVGDRTELATLTDVFGRAGATAGACVLGSVKSQIGHTKCAAGMAGMIKAALALYHGVLPPTLHIQRPNPAWDAATSPFRFLDAARPWTAARRVAAVSAFGFGGTNFHAVLEAHDHARTGLEAWPAELLLFRGADRAAAGATIAKVRARLAAAPPPRLRDLARSVCATGAGPVQFAIVADDLADLRTKLDTAEAGPGDRRGVFVASDVGGPVAFLCPGQGSQRPGMLAELFLAFPRLRRLLAHGARWAPTLLPAAAFSDGERAAQAAAITDTRVAQPTLGMADLAMVELLGGLGVVPAMAAGHSYGELAALAVAGALTVDDLLPLSAFRGEAILAAAGGDPGTMLAVTAGADVVAPLIAECAGVVIANHNSPRQCVLAGAAAAIDLAVPRLTAAGLTTRRFPVAAAFHSPLVADAQHALAARLAVLDVRAPRLPVWSNVTAAPYPAEPDGVRALLAEQVARPVLFAPQIEAMYAAGARVFVETGPGQVLTRLVGEILGDRPHVAIACDTGSGSSLRALLRAVATLAVHGVTVDAAALFGDRDARLIDLAPAKASKRPSAGWLIDGHTARSVDAPAPAPARPVALALASVVAPAASPRAAAPRPLGPSPTGAAPPPTTVESSTVASDRDVIVLEYLHNVRTAISAQRDVVLAYLGQAPAPMAEPLADHAPPRLRAGRPTLPAHPAAAPPPVVIDVAPEPTALDPMALVLEIVSERTGYPPETLGPDLDLEADLSIDSIKRIEIIGELAARLGLQVAGGGDDAMVEELATRKTLRALVDWLSDRLGAPSPGAAVAELATAALAEPAAAPLELGRYVFSRVAAPLGAGRVPTVAGRNVTVVDDGLGVAVNLASRLAADGADVTVVAPGDRGARPDVDGLIDLSGLATTVHDGDGATAAMTAMFDHVRDAVVGGASSLLVATGLGGRFGEDPVDAGLRGDGAGGLIKTVAAEWPSVRARRLDLDPREAPERLAELIHAELSCDDDLLEVGHAGGERATRTLVPAPSTSAGGLTLGPDAVVLITGGARGITARVAVELARRWRCQIELVGRSPLPGPEEVTLIAAADAPALRRAILAAGVAKEPAAIEAKVARVLADREIRATLAAITAAGATVRYHACDVRAPGFAEVIDGIYARHDRLDGVIHGAGVLEDKLIRHKTAASFARVYGTKVAGALTLAERLRPDTRFVVFFASISGALGNRGQVDYATANQALAALAAAMAPRISGRVVAIDWGPWAGTGMVSPELEREYARRGLGLIDPAAGVEHLLAELGSDARDTEVVIVGGDPRALAPRPVDHA
ncbi:MAG: SDR family NAD(P)-dependent oxidoreductase [Myxococcales bacterium]|nr:SDR family NAD(P)-dependent oxidoreductase [Myxococcales bacterium]